MENRFAWVRTNAPALGVHASACWAGADSLTRKFHTRLEWPTACSRNLQVAIARRPWAARRKLKFAATACEISGLAAMRIVRMMRKLAGHVETINQSHDGTDVS